LFLWGSRQSHGARKWMLFEHLSRLIMALQVVVGSHSRGCMLELNQPGKSKDVNLEINFNDSKHDLDWWRYTMSLHLWKFSVFRVLEGTGENLLCFWVHAKRILPVHFARCWQDKCERMVMDQGYRRGHICSCTQSALFDLELGHLASSRAVTAVNGIDHLWLHLVYMLMLQLKILLLRNWCTVEAAVHEYRGRVVLLCRLW
jgi:hypothetical protein